GDGALGVVAALHVDPQRPAVLACAGGESLRVCEGALDVDVVAELGELDADLAVQAARLDVVEEPDIVLGDRVGLVHVRDVLAEPGELAGDALGLEPCRRVEGAPRVFAGHEPAHGAAREPEPGKVVAQPAVPGHPQQQATHHAQPTASAANLFGAETNGSRVSSAMRRATFAANFGWLLRPVPT